MREKEYDWSEDRWLHEILFAMNRNRVSYFKYSTWLAKIGDHRNSLHMAKEFAWFQQRYEYYRTRLEELQHTK